MVVDDLAASKKGVPVKHLLWLGLTCNQLRGRGRREKIGFKWTVHQFLCHTFHGPMVDSGLRDESYGVEVDPLPEDDVVHHLMFFYHALHHNVVEDLQFLAS